MGSFSIAGADCNSGGVQAQFNFGVRDSGEEAHLTISSGYHGPGTYGPGTFGVTASVTHEHHFWYADFNSSRDASLTVGADGRSGSFSYSSQLDTVETLHGTFTCGG